MKRTAEVRKKILKASFALTLALMVFFGVFSFNTAGNDAEIAAEYGEHYITIEPEAPPLAPFGDGKSWALWNFILSIASATLALTVGIRALSKKKENEYNELFFDDYEKSNTIGLALILSISVIAAIGIILFILTQDMTLPMAMADLWTIAHAALLAGGIALYIFAYRSDRKSNNKTPA